MRNAATLATIATLASLAAAPLAAQQSAVEAHANFARTTQSNTNSWGAGALYQLTFGGKQAPVQLSTSLGADYLKEEGGGSSQTSGSIDVNLQAGGGSTVSPYVGGSVSENWLSGGDVPNDPKVGLEYIIGAQIKATPSVAVRVEVRPGYVKTQEHNVTYRLGFMTSF